MPNMAIDEMLKEIGKEMERMVNVARYHENKWRVLERDYVLPLFGIAEEMGFDLQQMVHDNPGRNCVQLFVEEVRKWRKCNLCDAVAKHRYCAIHKPWSPT